MEYFHLRRKIILAIFLASLFITFVAASSGYWIHWTILTSSFFMWLILDFMFMEEKQFVFEASLSEWQKKSQLDY